MLGRGTAELAEFAGPPPLLEPARIALVGCDRRESTEGQRQFIADSGISVSWADELSADPEGAARQALKALASAGSSVIVHFDVDVVDSGDLPLGNFPHYGSGVRLEHAAACLRVLLADPACAGLVLTEVNPTHNPGGSQLARYVGAVAAAMAP